MATSQAASSGAAVAVGGTAAAIRETIVGSQVLKIDGFSATKDLGVGKSIKSSTFNVGGHGWYMECYPCGVDEESADWVTLFLCVSDPKGPVDAACVFTSMVDDVEDPEYYHVKESGKLMPWGRGTDVMKRAELESLLESDCFQIRCEVSIVREFLTVHRGLPGPSAPVAASPTPAGAISSTVSGFSSGSHVLTIDGYSKTKKMFSRFDSIESECFVVGGRSWYIELYPILQELDDTEGLVVFLRREADEDQDGDQVLKVRFELTLLTFAREIISSAQFSYAFKTTDGKCRCSFPFHTETEPLLGDGFHVKCDVTVVKEITPMRPPDQHLHFSNLLASQVGTDVEFEVGSDLFSAHKCVLATRSSAFMAQFFGPAGKASTRVQIDDMEPRVFKALLHFIYTDTLSEVCEDDDKIGMAQGLLVAADRYAMERLKLICGDVLCTYVNDARMAVDTLELADKHGCRRLKEKCIKLLKGHFAKVAP